MFRRISDGKARQARAERALNGMIEYLLLLAFVTCVAVSVLTPLAWAIAVWYTTIATRLLLP